MGLKINYDQIISKKRSLELVNQGWKKADLHVHTWYSDDVLPFKKLDPNYLYKKALRKNLDFITFTDHDTMAAYDSIGWKKNKLVTGVEIEITDKKRVGHTIHTNVYGLSKEQFRDLREISLDERNIFSLLKYLKKNKLHYVYNHPYWCYNHEELNVDSVLKLVEHFPVLEYNMGIIKPLNKFSLFLAQKYNKGVIASTDSHIGRIGRVYTLAEGDNFDEYFRNIAMGKSYIVARSLTKFSFVNEINARMNHIFSKLKINTKPEINRFTFGESDKKADWLVKTILNDSVRNNIFMKNVFKGLLKTFIKTGLPAKLHFNKRHLDAKNIFKKMKNKFNYQ